MIDIILQQYLEDHSSDEPEILEKLRRATHLKTVYPQMLSGPVMGRFLMMISRLIQPAQILEIGTFTGYSAICLAHGLKTGGQLHTIENNPEMLEFAVPYFEEAGISEIVKIYCGNALEIIPDIDKTFDLVFIDAAKDQYLDYYKIVLDKVRPGGIILADNVLWSGKVLNPEPDDKDTAGIVQFNEYLKDDDRVEKVMLPIRDGILMIRKKSDG